MPAKSVLIALPKPDFDPSAVAVSWQLLRAECHRVRFATLAAARRPLGLRALAEGCACLRPALRRAVG